MPGHAYKEALLVSGAADNISKAIEESTVMRATSVADITTRDLDRTHAILLLTGGAFSLYEFQPSNTDPEDGITLIKDTNGRPYARVFVSSATGGIISFMFSDNFAAGEPLPFFPAVTNVNFLAGLPVSIALADVAPTAQAVFSIRKNWVSVPSPGTEVGTVTFAAASKAGVFAAAADFSLIRGDTLRLVAPDPADVALTGVSITLLATG